MDWLSVRQPEEEESGVGPSRKVNCCLQPRLGCGSTSPCPCGYRTVGCRGCAVILSCGIRGNKRHAMPGVVYCVTGLFVSLSDTVSCERSVGIIIAHG